MTRTRAASRTVDYLPEFGGAISIAEYDRPNASDDVETGQTIALMDAVTSADADAPEIEAAVHAALDEAGCMMSSSAFHKACAVYWWLKRTITYVPVPGTSRWVDQTLIAPTAVLAMPDPIGDCPQFSMLAAAMFHVLCIPTCFVTIKAEEEHPDQWSHVYNTVEIGPGSWMPFDSSNGPEPGAEYARAFDKRIWPRLNKRACRRKEKASEMVRAAKQSAGAGGGMRNRALRHQLGRIGRLGDVVCDQDGNCYDDSTGTLLSSSSTDPYGNNIITVASPSGAAPDVVPPGGINLTPTNTSSVPSSSPSSGLNLTSLLSTLGNDAASVASTAIRAGTGAQIITGANGQQYSYNPATGAMTPLTSSALTSSSGLLLLAALGIGLVAFSGKH